MKRRKKKKRETFPGFKKLCDSNHVFEKKQVHKRTQNFKRMIDCIIVENEITARELTLLRALRLAIADTEMLAIHSDQFPDILRQHLGFSLDRIEGVFGVTAECNHIRHRNARLRAAKEADKDAEAALLGQLSFAP